MRRTITNFHQDEVGDWVAELDCLHGQHVRHRPPFQEFPWVTTHQGRDGRIGTQLDCPLCDRTELPDGLEVLRIAGPFDETTLPSGLLHAHRVAAGRWGRLVVHQGSVGLSLSTDPPLAFVLRSGDSQPIPPGVEHHLQLSGAVRLVLEFLGPPEPPTEGSTTPAER